MTTLIRMYEVEYKAWINMRLRCHSEKHAAYHNYGGRGISVCDRWRESFKAFIEDMGPKPSPELTLDRIDNDGNYEPVNCAWRDRKTQQNNRRVSNRKPGGRRMVQFWKKNLPLKTVTHNGETHSVAEWSEKTGLSTACIYKRMRRGLSAAQILAPKLS